MGGVIFWGILGLWICIVAIKYILESQNIPFPAIGVYLSFYGFMLFCSWLFYDNEPYLENKINTSTIPEVPQAISESIPDATSEKNG